MWCMPLVTVCPAAGTRVYRRYTNTPRRPRRPRPLVSGLENGCAQNRLDGVGGDRPKLAQIAAPFDGDHRQLKQPADDDERHVRRQRVGSDLGLLATPRLAKIIR